MNAIKTELITCCTLLSHLLRTIFEPSSRQPRESFWVKTDSSAIHKSLHCDLYKYVLFYLLLIYHFGYSLQFVLVRCQSWTLRALVETDVINTFKYRFKLLNNIGVFKFYNGRSILKDRSTKYVLPIFGLDSKRLERNLESSAVPP